MFFIHSSVYFYFIFLIVSSRIYSSANRHGGMHMHRHWMWREEKQDQIVGLTLTWL